MTLKALDVLLGSVSVGRLVKGETGRVVFTFGERYRRLPGRPVLSQFLEDDLDKHYRGKPGRLPAFFANLLPEGALRGILEDRLGVSFGDDFCLLSAVGHDLPGAVVLRNADGPDLSSSSGAEDEEAPDSPPVPWDGFRFSLAGVQLKFSMLREDGVLTLPARDQSGRWIAKLASPRWPGLPENEYSILEWARAAGFEVPECILVSEASVCAPAREFVAEGSRVLAVRRYDRSDRHDERRIHQEDFAQAVGLLPEHRYDHISYVQMARLAKAFVGDDVYDEIIRRLVLVIAAGNNDAHLKNWSLLYPNGITATLAPLYDQVATVAWREPDRRLALNLVWKKQFADLDESEFKELALRCEEPPGRTMDIVHETLERLSGAWRARAVDWPMFEEHKTALYEHWRSVPLLRRSGFNALSSGIPSKRPRRPRHDR